tara:strand:+ start:218 stop:499 length:282 start_codon:yes stop_codon:yes gene_type:complete
MKTNPKKQSPKDKLMETLSGTEVTFTMAATAIVLYLVTVAIASAAFPLLVAAMLYMVVKAKLGIKEKNNEKSHLQFSTRTYSSGDVRSKRPDV